MSKRTASPGLGSLATGAVTALALAVQTGLAAVVGVIVAHEFGRGAVTDGFFASYGVFAVLALAANAVRVTILPALARAHDARRLGGETTAYVLAGGAVALPLLALAAAARGPIAAVLTGFGPHAARDAAAATLPWMVFAALCQLLAGMAASALAALDDYAVAAAGFIGGSVAGLALIVARVHPDGIRAVSWGMALNGLVALGVPSVELARRARRESMPRHALRPADGLSPLRRLPELGSGVAFPLALQAVYLICLPLAAGEGVGAVTSFSYAYLIGAAVVAVTASSLGLVTSVPLTRSGIDPAGVARHVVASSWLALAAVAGVAGVFALAGGRIASAVLGARYAHHVGDELGRLVVVLAPWMVTSVGVSVTFPVMFVAQRGARLPLVAAGAVVAQAALAVVLRLVFGLDGLAVSLAVTTGLALAAMLALLNGLRATVRGLAFAAVAVAVPAAAAFGVAGVLLDALPAALVGAVAYGSIVLAVRPPGLRRSWRYLRALG